MSGPLDWLVAHGAVRKCAVEEAASRLLRDYRVQWPKTVPTQLHHLAASLGARILPVKALEGGARLVPVPGGFLVLVSDEIGLEFVRYRTCIAHELAHTLFYSRDSATMRRLAEPTKAEEYFCFDVARRVLAPKWLLDEWCVGDVSDAEAIFKILLEKFRLSKPVAARVILEDYILVSGVAGRWNRHDGDWVLDPSRSYASPSLRPAQRRLLHAQAHQWLEGGAQPSTAQYVLPWKIPSGDLKSVYAYLSSGLIEGIGPALARRIVERFADDTISIIREGPERLLHVPGIGQSKLASIVEAFREQTTIRVVGIIESSSESAFVLVQMHN